MIEVAFAQLLLVVRLEPATIPSASAGCDCPATTADEADAGVWGALKSGFGLEKLLHLLLRDG